MIGCHSIFGAYGFWLPNDPRGSWSDFVRAWELVRFGKATKVDTHASLAHAEHDVPFRLKAKESLRYPPVAFTGRQALAVGEGFAEAAAEGGYVVHACAILPEHVHIVFGQQERDPRKVVGHLKARATQRLLAKGLHPLAAHASHGAAPPSPWARLAWHVYLDDDVAMRAAIEYVRNNPLKEGKPPQRWSFVECR